MRVVAILVSYNDEQFIGGCLEHLSSQGVEACLIDVGSTDKTVEIAEGYLDRNLIRVENLPRVGRLPRWERMILRRKEELTSTIDADWFMHTDPDEIRLSPRSNLTLLEALSEVDEAGYNAVNFVEFTFVPTREAPQHDHPDFVRTMRHYYPFISDFPYRVNAWKRQQEVVNLAHVEGHSVRFPGLCVYPEPFKMKHYQFLSLEHARVKYLEKNYEAEDVRKDTRRCGLVEERMRLPSESCLNLYTSDGELSFSKPRLRHILEDWTLPAFDRQLSERIDGTQGAKGSFKLPGHTAISQRAVPTRGQILVAGFHRSGTSLTAQLLHRSGVFLGQELLLRNRSQPQGHFEDREIKNLHDKILADNGLTWQVGNASLPIVGEHYRRIMREIVERREADRHMWGFKDPRVCLFLNVWKTLLPDAKVLLVYRHFTEATRSLHRRAANALFRGTGRPDDHRRFWEVPDLALKMWLAHNKALIDFARSYPEDVLAVSFDMLRRGFPLLGSLNRYWGLALRETPTSDVFLSAASAEPLGRQLVSEQRLIGETLDTWGALEQLGRRTGELTAIPAGIGELPTEEAFYLPTDAYASEIRKEFAEFELRYFQERLGEGE